MLQNDADDRGVDSSDTGKEPLTATSTSGSNARSSILFCEFDY